MKISTIAIGLMVLFAATTVAIAMGPPEDKGRQDMDPKIEIGLTTVSFLFFSIDDVDTWEINVTWNEKYGIPDSATYTGTIVYDDNSPAYNVQFTMGEESDLGGDVSTMPITIRQDGDMLYPITATATTSEGETITVIGILDFNPVE